MKVLSIYQPYASLVMLGHRFFHTVPWKPGDVSGEVHIYAMPDRSAFVREAFMEQPAHKLLEEAGLNWDNAPFGRILGTVEVVGIEPAHKAVHQADKATRKTTKFPFGWFALRLANPKLLKKPFAPTVPGIAWDSPLLATRWTEVSTWEKEKSSAAPQPAAE